MKRFFLWFRSFCVTSFPFVAFALVICNFIVSCSVYRTAHPRYFYKTFVITNEVHSVVSSTVPFSVSSPESSSKSSEYSPSVVPVDYDYMVLSSSPVIRLFGRVYREGDVTSHGLILRIFPDRVFLHDGTVLENSRHSNSDRNLKRIKANDR